MEELMMKKKVILMTCLVIVVCFSFYFSYNSNKNQRTAQIIKKNGIDYIQVKNTFNLSAFDSIKVTAEFPADTMIWDELHDGTRLYDELVIYVSGNDELKSNISYVRVKEDLTLELVMRLGIKKAPTGYLLFIEQSINNAITKTKITNLQIEKMIQ